MKKLIVVTIFFLSCIFVNGINISLSDDIAIVSINKETVEKIGPYPFSRDKYADLIESLYSDYSPKCVYFNLLIYQYQQDSMAADKRLFDAIKNKQNIFFSAMTSDAKVEHNHYVNSQFNRIIYNRIWQPAGATFPLKDIAQSGAFTSISDVGLDRRGIVEKMPTIVQIDSNKYFSTPLFLTIKYLGIAPEDLFSGNSLRFGNSKVKVDRNGWFEIDFDHEFSKYSYHDILNKKAKKESIDQRIILVGIDFPELESYLLVSRNRTLAGVEVIANATQTLIDQLRQ